MLLLLLRFAFTVLFDSAYLLIFIYWKFASRMSCLDLLLFLKKIDFGFWLSSVLVLVEEIHLDL